MKKIFTLLFTLGYMTSVFAQNGYHNERWNQPTDDHQTFETIYNNNAGHYDQTSTVDNNASDWNRPSNHIDNHYHQHDGNRTTGYDDRRNNDYGYDRPAQSYPRDKRYQPFIKDENNKAKTFSGGVVVGAVAGILLGVLLSK